MSNPLRRSLLGRLALPVSAALLIGIPIDLSAQAHRLLPPGHPAYDYIERLQRRGLMLELNPTALPYTYGSVQRAAGRVDGRRLSRTERRWLELLHRETAPAGAQTVSGRRRGSGERGRKGGRQGGRRTRSAEARYTSDGTAAGMELGAGLAAINTDRLDVLRPTDAGDPHLQASDIRFYPNAHLNAYLERGPFIAQGGLRFDVYYRDDPDGLEAANRLITRNERSYVGFGSRFFSAYLGRMQHHWAPPSATPTILSRNVVGFDQLHLRIGGERIAWRSVLGELDSATPDGRFTGTAGADSVGGSIRRFIAAHRLDWRPSRHVTLSFLESVLFSGENTGVSLKFLNPLLIQAFAVDGRPKNDENNGFIAGLLWANVDRFTLHGQLLIDDIDLQRQTGEAASIALSGAAIYAGPSFDAGGDVALVAARTYNTHQPEGRYVHLLRGLATQFSDFIHAGAFVNVFADRITPGLSVMPRIDLLLQGEQDMRLPYPATGEADFVLNGTVERTVRTSVNIAYQPSNHFWARFDLGPNFVSNAGHIDGRSRVRWIGLLQFGVRVRVDDMLRLSL